MNTNKSPNFQAARLAAAGIKGSLMQRLHELRKIGANKRKNTTPHKRK